MRVRGVVAYDGTEYRGFQRQANGLTVQQVLETGLSRVTQEAITLRAAGRTDAGVHAVGQVVAFDTAWRHTVADLQRALNAVLPGDVVFRQLEEASADFHPRYDALSRRYRYRVYNGPVRCPLGRQYSLHVAKPLDLDAMQRAAQVLLGEHDFATFGQPPQGRVTVRQVLLAEWEEVPPRLSFNIEANAFLYRMVRSIVGTLLEVGRGAMTVDGFAAALSTCDRSQAGPTAPPHGLCLVEVKY